MGWMIQGCSSGEMIYRGYSVSMGDRGPICFHLEIISRIKFNTSAKFRTLIYSLHNGFSSQQGVCDYGRCVWYGTRCKLIPARHGSHSSRNRFHSRKTDKETQHNVLCNTD